MVSLWIGFLQQGLMTNGSCDKLPLGLLNAAQGHPMLVELKNGETLNGHLVNCDTWMNLTLKEVVQTNPEGTAFFRLPESKTSSRINLQAEVEVEEFNVAEATEDEAEQHAEDVAEAGVEEPEPPQILRHQDTQGRICEPLLE
ncbi:MAG: hypothetical protein Q9216_002718 [Gyalolechia sp. 2 TL-2023]